METPTLRVVQLNAGSLLEPGWPERRAEIVAWLDRDTPALRDTRRHVAEQRRRARTQDDVRTPRREQLGDRAADALGRSRDDRGPAGEVVARSAHGPSVSTRARRGPVVRSGWTGNLR